MKKAMKIGFPIVLVVLLAGLAFWYFFLYNPSYTADHYISRAETQMEKGNYKKAISL